LTHLGSKFYHAPRNKVHLVKQQISKIEPFKSAFELATHGVSSAEVTQDLSERGIIWHHEPELNEAAIHSLLIHWAIYAGLLRYNGKNRKFQRHRDQT